MKKPKLTVPMRRVLERMAKGACIVETEWWVFMSDKLKPFVPFQITETPTSNMSMFYLAAERHWIRDNNLDFKGVSLRIWSITPAGRKALKEKGE
jgi:hypothetical protein